MIVPARRDAELLGDIAAAAGASADHVHLWWLGQSGFLVQWRRRHLLLDPYLSDSLTAKYAATDKPHVRMTALAVDPRRLDFVDVVTSSHHHTDHLDAETLVPLRAASPGLRMVVPEASRDFAAERLGFDRGSLVGIDAGGQVDVAGFTLHAVPAAHESLERDAAGRHRYLGFVVRCGEWTVYHSGDTVRYPGMAELLRPFAIDVALLPINGRAPERRVAGNLDGREAAELARDIGAGILVPCHFEMFAFNTASPDDLVAACRALGQPCRVLRSGERWSSCELPSGPRSRSAPASEG